MVKVSIDGEKASDEYVYADTSAAKFAITPQGRYTLRPGDYIDASRSVAKTDIVISEAYKVIYDQNTSNTAALSNMPATTAKYWYEAGQISAAVPVWDGVKFLGWDEAADCETPKYNAGDFIPADQNRDITLYAKWEDKILVVYDGNGNTNASAVGAEKTTFVTKQQIDLAGGYTVEKNTGNTDFEKTGTTYVGWDGSSHAAVCKVSASARPITSVTVSGNNTITAGGSTALKAAYKPSNTTESADVTCGDSRSGSSGGLSRRRAK